MVLELYLDLDSQPCRAVYIFAKKNNIPFEFKHVDLMKMEQRAEWFLKVNPVGLVPAMKDGDFVLSESIAILLYLAKKFNVADHWYPSDLEKRARVDEYLAWQHTTVRRFGCEVFIIKALAPILLDPLPPQKLEAAVKDLDEALRLFEGKFLQDRPFIAGHEVSLADLMAIEEILQVVASGHDVLRSRPKMAAWRSRVEEAIGKKLFQEAHKTLFHPQELSADHVPPALMEPLKESLVKWIR